MLALALVVLAGAASLRGMEYDEGYTVFLAAGDPRPVWPAEPTQAGQLRGRYAGASSLVGIARDLRATDVHPPLYFWAVAFWRAAFGTSLWTTRLFSVLCSLGALALVGRIAAAAAAPAVPAMLLTLGSYGFAYTGQTARGFALAQLLSVLGLWLTLTAPRQGGGIRPAAAGLSYGAACLANYLALFGALAALFWLLLRSPRAWRCWLPAGAAFAFCLPLGYWFFIAQRDSRGGQFPPFHLLGSAVRLAAFAVASLFGGLPRYLDEPGSTLLAAALGLGFAALLALIFWRWRRIGRADARWLLALAAAAPPAGLLVLGAVFDSTPIELRYLAFGAPPFAVLLAGVFAGWPRWGRLAQAGVLAVQAAALAGLLTRPETMQPQRAVALEAAAQAGTDAAGTDAAGTDAAGTGTVALVPFGNDGVGVLGSFVAESPDRLRVLPVRRGALPDPALLPASRAVLALLGLDDDSRAVLPGLQAAFDGAACWTRSAAGFDLLVYVRRC